MQAQDSCATFCVQGGWEGHALPLTTSHPHISHLRYVDRQRERQKQRGEKGQRALGEYVCVCEFVPVFYYFCSENEDTHRQIISCNYGAAVLSQTQVLTHNETQKGVFLR